MSSPIQIPLWGCLSPGELRELASLLDERDPRRQANRQLSEEGINRLAEILAAGSRPTIGFWRRYGQERRLNDG